MKNRFIEGRARTIAITAGKGGVGKTSIALKFSLALANMNQKVLLIDCDHNLSNTSVKLDIRLEERFQDLLTGTASFEECLYKQGNFHLLRGCTGNLELFRTNPPIDLILIDLIADQREHYDYIILDCPAGILKPMANLNAYCDDRIFIVNPDKSSITDSYALMKILKLHYGISQNHLIINRVDEHQDYLRIVRAMSETAENFLSCRTMILGAIMEVRSRQVSFDNIFLFNEESTHHQNFLKIVSKYSDLGIGQIGVELHAKVTSKERFAV